jgi:hypothetical protein
VKGKKIAIISVCVVMVAGALFLLANMELTNASKIGSDSSGYVTKVVYSHYGQSTTKIAIVTGMHPRESVSKTVVPSVIKSYALTHNVEIVNYQVNVTDDPENFAVGRSNGQGLVANYVIPDIEKSNNYSLVIICHDHESGYGNGFYIATPTMDTKSVALGEAVHSLLSQFNYYQRSTDEDAISTSINQVDAPIASNGTPVFVYEIPEQSDSQEASEMTYKLIDTCFNVIKTNNS